jgi:hypothetical protein
MAQFYDTHTYIAASMRLDSVCAWLEGLGINYSPTRVGRYRKIFSSIARHQDANTLNTFFEEYSRASLVNAAHEVAELVRIFEGLSQTRDTSFVSRLRDALKGHELFVLDDNNSSGRDFTLELSIAAKFVRADLPVDFGHNADLCTQFQDHEFFVECKRLKSSKQIERRIKEGLTQLKQRYADSEDPLAARGILVLGTTKLVNSELGVLKAENQESLDEKVFAYNQAFIETYRSLWQLQVDARTLGTVVVLDAPGFVGITEKLITCHEVAMNNSVPINTKSYALLRELADRVFKGKPNRSL